MSICKNSKIPLLTAANLEDGGNGAATQGTAYGNQMAVAATNCSSDDLYSWRNRCKEGKQSELTGAFHQ